MSDALQFLLHLDQEAIRATGGLRWGPATEVLVLVSAWWVKGPLLVGAGWCSDLRCRRVFPLAAAAATVAFFVASGLNQALKDLVGRSRPPEAMGFEALVGVPTSPSFPSGHAMSAFAVAGALALVAPRLRWPVLALAAVIGFSRVYLGVHFWIDVLAGAALGLAIGIGVAWLVRRSTGGRVSELRWDLRTARLIRARREPGRAAQRDRELPDLPPGHRAQDHVEREVRAEGHARHGDGGQVWQQHDAQARRHRAGGHHERGRDDQMTGGERGNVAPAAVVTALDLGAERLFGPRPVDGKLEDLEDEVGEDAGEQHHDHRAGAELQAARAQ
jgi:membrane-associated phospholipid phosphatase